MSKTVIPTMIVDEVELRVQPSLLTDLVDPIDCDHGWEPHSWDIGSAYCLRCGSRARWVNDPRVSQEITS